MTCKGRNTHRAVIAVIPSALTCIPAYFIMEFVNIHEVHENWTALGNEDPMWVVLTDASRKGNKWDEDDFFATGRRDIKTALEKLQSLKVELEFDRAMDFGCGVGRLSQALAEYFASVDGVDVSASMIEHAERLNKHPQKVAYHLNVSDNLSRFPSDNFDFIYSLISLQHIPPHFQRKYISEFVRLLKPRGIAFFQTIHAHRWRKLIPHTVSDFYRRLRSKGKAFIPLYGIPTAHVRRAIEQPGGIIKKHDCSPYHGHESRYVCDHYVVTRDGPAQPVRSKAA